MKWILLLLFLIPMVFAYTKNDSIYETTFIMSNGQTINVENLIISSTQEGYGNNSNNNITVESGILYLLPEQEDEENIIQIIISSGGGGQNKVITPFYDVLLDTQKDIYFSQLNKFYYFLYKKDNIVDFNITIINRGDVPDKDAILRYYLLSPNGTIYKEKRHTFIEVPVSCKTGVYNIEKDLCEINNSYYAPNAFIVEDSLTLPLYAEVGEWQLFVHYTTEVQPEINVFSSFEVAQQLNLLFIFISIIILGIVYMVLSTRGEKSEKK